MMKDFKSAFSRSSHGNLWRVGRGVVLQEQNAAGQFTYLLTFLTSFLRFPGVTASICQHNRHCLLCDLSEDNQS